MELKGITREWNTLKKDSAARVAAAAPLRQRRKNR